MKQKEQIGFHYGAGILLISAVAVKIIGALFKIPIASDYCLTDRGFGYFSYAYDFFTPFYTIAMSGFPVALAQIVAKRNSENGGGEAAFFSARRLFERIGIVFSGLVLLLVAVLALLGKSSSWILPVVSITPAAFFCSAMSSYRGYYEGFGDMKPTAVSELLEASGKLILGFSFAYFTVKLTGNYAWGATASMLGISLGTAVAYCYLRNSFRKRNRAWRTAGTPLRERDDPALRRTLVGIALPVTLAALSVNMVPLIDAITAQATLGADLYGLRAKAYTLYNLVPSFSVLLAVSAVPAVAHSVSVGEKGSLRRNVRTVFKFSALLSFPMAAGLIAASGGVMDLLYGSGDSVLIGGKLLRIFGFSAFFTGLAIPMTGILQAIGKQKRALYHIFAGASLKILLNCLLIRLPSVHVYGTAYATLACYFCIFVLHGFTLVREVDGFLPDAAVCLKPLLASAACGVTAWALLLISSRKAVTLLAITAAVFVYFLLLILLKSLSVEELPEPLQDNCLVKFCMKHRIFR